MSDVYSRLSSFLDNMPGGFPKTESGVEIKILKKLFTEQEAEMVMKLKSMPEPLPAIAQRWGMSEKEASEKLESLARQGSILRARLGGAVLYWAVSYVVGVYEFHLNSLDRELSELMEEYLPHLAKVHNAVQTRQMRVVPIASSLPHVPAVSTYDKIRELVKDKHLISVAPCICAKEQRMLGHTCSRPEERCIGFDVGAAYYIENGLGRQIDQAELMDILKMGEEKALVLNPTNSTDIMNVCLCCSCCCGVLRMLRQMPRPGDFSNAAFRAQIDPEACSACGTCQERCQIEAIKEGDDYYQVDPARCIGCGLCVSACPEEAISLAPRNIERTIPANIMEMNLQIARERGVLGKV